MIRIDQPSQLAPWLRKLTAEAGLTRRALAAKCGVRPSQIDAWLDGALRPNAASLLKLLDGLGHYLALIPREDAP